MSNGSDDEGTPNALRLAGAVTLIDVRSHGLTPGVEAEILLTPEVLHLEAAAMMPISGGP